ncbi:MAG: hypothetical protein ACTSQ8_20150 [Candidatus Helarchaeota archaeon]
MTAENFSVQYIVPEGQYLDDSILFDKVFVLAQDGDDEETMDLYSIPNDDPDMIIQVSDGSYNYTLDYGVLENRLRALHGQEKELVKNSFVYIQAWYNSSSLMYELEHEPFNYKYLGDEHDAFHIGLYINGELIAYSNESLFEDYVEKIKEGYIYFNERNETDLGYISPQSEIKLAYKYKLQPGLLDRKHFLIVVYPWSNVFEESLEYSDSPMLYREKYRKLSGGSIIAPFEYSLSIDEKYSLYLAYRLNRREYMEEKFKFDYASRNFEFTYLKDGIENYVSETFDGEDIALTVYYYDENGNFQVLDDSHYDIDLNHHKIILKDDGNIIVTPNSISEFYVSFIPRTQDLEISDHEFTYNPMFDASETIKLSYWRIEGDNVIDPLPNLDAPYFLIENETSMKKVTCRASQIMALIKNNSALIMDLDEILLDIGEQFLDALHDGDYIKLHVEMNIRNLESLQELKVELHDASGLMSGFTQWFSREQLEMFDGDLIISLPTIPNSLKLIKIIPKFRTDGDFSPYNDKGILRTEVFEWKEDEKSQYPDGYNYMKVELGHELKVNENEEQDMAFLFDEDLNKLKLIGDLALNYTIEDDGTSFLLIPKEFMDPVSNMTSSFEDGEVFVVKYYSPIKRHIVAGLGKMFLEYKGCYHDSNPDLPKAEFLLVNANSTISYDDFLSDYYLEVPLEVTPFETEYNNKYKMIKIELNTTQLFNLTGASELYFSHLLFSVPDPSYELTLGDVIIIEESTEPVSISGSMEERVWRYTQVETFKSSTNPEEDCYVLTLDEKPLLYPNIDWLDLVKVYDNDGNYYTVGMTGDDHQLHFNPSNNTLTWNPSFNQFPEHFGMTFEEPLIIAPNKTLYFEYATNASWMEPIIIEENNIDLSSIIITYDFGYLLKPEFYDWYVKERGIPFFYEYFAYSFDDTTDYKVVQYLVDSFTVYSNETTFTHAIDVESYSLSNDFANLSLYQVVGVTQEFNSVMMLNNSGFDINFNATAGTITISDLNSSNGLLNEFARITVILNFSCGPISSYTEIKLLKGFNDTFLSDQEESFYNSLEINYKYLKRTGEQIFSEPFSMMTSNNTSFKAINFNRNPDVSDNFTLKNYGSRLFDNFKIYEDESSIILASDGNMDGSPEFKQFIDINKDGKIDIVRYGIENTDTSGEIIWYLTIQEYEQEEVDYDRKVEEEMRTPWFDLDDRIFAYYDWNIFALIGLLMSGPLLQISLLNMIMPDMDYWAQKSVQREVITEQHVKSVFYSVLVDEDKDGNVDSQVNFERTAVDVSYTINEYKRTSIAAKYQNSFLWFAEYVVQSLESLMIGKRRDFVFNDDLTVEMIENNNFSSCNSWVKLNSGFLRSTYRKFTENLTTTYSDSFDSSRLAFIDYGENGKLIEKRIYSDEFDTGEIDEVGEYFDDLMGKHLSIQFDNEISMDVELDPQFPMTIPSNISWSGETWGMDGVPIKYDGLTVQDENGIFTTNAFQKKIILRIPNRYSLYNDYGKISRESVKDDGWVKLEATGIMIHPQDGLVYYTSDHDSFINDQARINGLYFFVDSDQNGFHETVYVLASSRTTNAGGLEEYDVISIGYNQDGVNDLVPYEKLNVHQNMVSDYGELASEKTKFGGNWVYTFSNLKREPLLGIGDVPSNEELYKTKDVLFEAYKLTTRSMSNPKFSELFYEIRHEEYSRAWAQYKKQLLVDIVEQVFMSVTASVLSAAVETILTSTVVGATVAKIMGALTYFTVYTLMTKFFIDMKLRKSDAIAKAHTFIPVSMKSIEPINLNEKSLGDRLWGDSMTTALFGHPGGYYTTVKGFDDGKIYQAQLLVTPPNPFRCLKAYSGFYKLLVENFFNMGESDPDSFTALDFDNANLDYFMLTSELPSYNLKRHYTLNLKDPLGLYKEYALNSMGYLENEIKTISSLGLSGIRPTWTLTSSGTVLEYQFFNKIEQAKVAPLDILYKPIVICKERYDQLKPQPIELAIDVAIDGLKGTLGIQSSDLSDAEKQVYAGKISLLNGPFNYPIESVFVDVIETEYKRSPVPGKFFEIEKVIAKGIKLNDSDYVLDCGSLYLKSPLSDLVSSKYLGIQDRLKSASTNSYSDFSPKFSYRVRIKFNTVIQDDSEETKRLSLAQATSFVVMDYFNQYTYALTTANMISEIAYTETVTFWSTYISAPLVFLGSWAVKGYDKFIAEAGKQVVKKQLGDTAAKASTQPIKAAIAVLSALRLGIPMLLSPLREVFEEIVIDDIIETLLQNGISILGGTQDMGFWASSLGTSGRELMGSLREMRDMGMEAREDLDLTEREAVKDASNMESKEDDIIQSEMEEILALKFRLEGEKNLLRMLLLSDILRGALFLLPSIFLGSMDILAIFRNKICKLIHGTGYSLKWLATARARKQARRQAELEVKRTELRKILGEENIEDAFSINSVFYENLQSKLKIPVLDSSIDDTATRADKLDIFGQEIVTISTFPRIIDAKLDNERRSLLTDTFLDLNLKDWVGELAEEPIIGEIKSKLQEILKNTRKLDYFKRINAVLSEVKKHLKEQNSLSTRFVDPFGVVYIDPHFVLHGFSHIKRSHYEPEKDIDIPEDMSIKEFIEELKKIYMIPYDIRISIFKDGEEIRADSNSKESFAKWLEDNGFLPDKQNIHLFPEHNKLKGPLYDLKKFIPESGEPNPYYKDFDDFREEFIALLVRYRLIEKRDPIEALNFFITPQEIAYSGKKYLEGERREEDIFENVFKALEKGAGQELVNTLIRMIEFSNAMILNELSSRLRDGLIIQREYRNAVIDFEDLFDYQYKIFGVSSDNPFYHKGRMLTYRIIDLLKANGILNKWGFNYLMNFLNSYLPEGMKIERKGIKFDYYRTSNNPPKLETIINFHNKVKLALKNYARHNSINVDFLIESINELFNEYEDEIKDIKGLESLFRKMQKNNNNQPFQYEILLRKIVGCNPKAFGKINSMQRLSLLLCGKKWHLSSKIKSGYIERRPDPMVLFRFVYTSKGWNTKIFKELSGYEITDFELDRLKDSIENVIKEWMFSNPYEKEYIDEHPKRLGTIYTKDFLEPEYNLIKYIWMGAVAIHDNLDLSFLKLKKELGMSNIYEHLTGSFSCYNFDADSLKKIRSYLSKGKKVLERRLLDDPQNDKLEWRINMVDSAMIEVEKYFLKRHLNYDSKDDSSETGSYREGLWKSIFMRAYHVISLLYRDLGFDPLGFEPLRAEFFDGNQDTGLYQRHHINKRRKWSVFLDDLLLTSYKYHNYYNNMEIKYQKALLKTIQDLIHFDNSNPDHKLTSGEVKDILMQNFECLDGNKKDNIDEAERILKYHWKFDNEKEFSDKLETFNKRRDAFLRGEFEKIIKKDYGIVHERFFEKCITMLEFLLDGKKLKGFSIDTILSEADIAFLSSQPVKLIRI